MLRHHAHRRDSSLQKLSRANRWLLAGSVALTALLTEVAAQAFPGKASASSTAPRAGAAKAPRHPSSQHSVDRSPSKSLTPPAKAPEASEPTSEAAREPSEQASREPAHEATHEAAPETHEPSSSASESAPAAPQASPEPQESKPAPEESSAPVVSGGS
jgi:hypothetical protein